MKTISEEKKQRFRLMNTLRWRLTLFVFLILVISGIATLVFYSLILLLFAFHPLVVAITVNPYTFIITLLCICSVIGTLLSGFLGKYYLRPLKQLIAATEQVKKGNFKVQVEEHGNKDKITEMGALITSFNEMVRELDGIELFRNDFINNFSHEFKTPIVSIRGFAKELQMGDLSEEQRQEYAKIIAEEADRLARLSISVLELSKLENQQIVTNKSEFYLDEQLRQCILLQEPVWSAKGIDVLPELEEVRFYSNEEILSHIWSNLIGNALKFTPEGGQVRIALQDGDDAVTVTVADTGIGMTEEVRKHIFEKFYQGDPSHHSKGYGVGLTMVARAVGLCGGAIGVESTPGEGSVFTVRLPKERPPILATEVVIEP